MNGLFRRSADYQNFPKESSCCENIGLCANIRLELCMDQERRVESEQLPRLPGAAFERNALGRGAHCAKCGKVQQHRGAGCTADCSGCLQCHIHPNGTSHACVNIKIFAVINNYNKALYCSDYNPAGFHQKGLNKTPHMLCVVCKYQLVINDCFVRLELRTCRCSAWRL